MFLQIGWKMTDRSAINLTPISDELGKAALSLVSIVPPGELRRWMVRTEDAAEMGKVASGIH